MNVLEAEQVDAIRGMFRDGYSIREIADKLGIAKGTVMRYRGGCELPEKCRCGLKYGHRGWCTDRYSRSLLRQYTLHPQKFIPILDRLTELWMRLPLETKMIAVHNSGGKWFSELTIKTKLQLLECGWSHVQRILEDEKADKEYREEMEWLRESRKIMKRLKEAIKG